MNTLKSDGECTLNHFIDPTPFADTNLFIHGAVTNLAQIRTSDLNV